jgi:FtsZ-interacting cell division protein YlmF
VSKYKQHLNLAKIFFDKNVLNWALVTTTSSVGLNNLSHQYTGQITVPYSQQSQQSSSESLQQQQQQQPQQQQQQQQQQTIKSDRTVEKSSREATTYDQDMINATILHQQQSKICIINSFIVAELEKLCLYGLIFS